MGTKTQQEQQQDALKIAVSITKQAVRGGYDKQSPAEMLQDVYQTALALLQPVEPEEKPKPKPKEK